MHTHEITVISEGRYNKAICQCKLESPVYQHKWEAEDWGNHHLLLTQRVIANLTRGNVSLAKQRAYFREMEANPEVSEEHRAKWKALADELDRRINDQGPADEGQEALFSLETERQKP